MHEFFFNRASVHIGSGKAQNKSELEERRTYNECIYAVENVLKAKI
ncbi:MAG: hypothetical protein M0Z61_13155 [Nitrospiraceae bacterium]|nr:hypothetical protein [Nitrospiraceae bacterium]